MSWSVATRDGERDTIPALVSGPCIIEYGRIIATVSDLDVALKAAAAVNAEEDRRDEGGELWDPAAGVWVRRESQLAPFITGVVIGLSWVMVAAALGLHW